MFWKPVFWIVISGCSAMIRRRNRKRREQIPSINWGQIRRTAVAGTTLAAVAGAVVVLFLLLDRPITKIQIDGPFARVNASQVEAAVVENLRGGFISADINGLASSVRRHLWVDQVRVRREWPDGLRITLIEQTPAARWGESGLLNVRGELFIEDTRHIPAGLPTLYGPAGSEREIAMRFLSIREQLLPRGIDIASLGRDPRGAWSMTLSNGVIVKLGRRDLDRRLARFSGLVLDVVAADMGGLEYVDMRYSHGFAIGWQESRSAAKPAAQSTARSG